MSQKPAFDANKQTNNQAKSQESLSVTPPVPENSANKPKREPIKHPLTGSPQLVKRTIYYLNLIGYAQESDWSLLSPDPDNPEKVISILIRNIIVE